MGCVFDRIVPPLNLLEDYISSSLPRSGDFSTNPRLREKVREDGTFLPFYGNTTVFLLDGETKAALGLLQVALYRAAPGLLAERLTPDTFHMTLHDLENGPCLDAALMQRMEKAERGAKALLARWQDQPPLRMKATWLFNMVNTSVVLGLSPPDGDTGERLSRMYAALERVVPLGYALTPHITMAYFRPGTYSQEALEVLRCVLGPVELEINLKMENLVYQEFRDMNHYEDG